MSADLQVIEDAVSRIRGTDGVCRLCGAPPQCFHEDSCEVTEIRNALNRLLGIEVTEPVSTPRAGGGSLTTGERRSN